MRARSLAMLPQPDWTENVRRQNEHSKLEDLKRREKLAKKALRCLGVRTLAFGRRRAAIVFARTPGLPCCGSPLAHVFHRIGSTLFLDDDPAALARAFPAVEREQFGERFLAACIVLVGRERVSLFSS